jgi:hypothetical protein
MLLWLPLAVGLSWSGSRLQFEGVAASVLCLAPHIFYLTGLLIWKKYCGHPEIRKGTCMEPRARAAQPTPARCALYFDHWCPRACADSESDDEFEVIGAAPRAGNAAVMSSTAESPPAPSSELMPPGNAAVMFATAESPPVPSSGLQTPQVIHVWKFGKKYHDDPLCTYGLRGARKYRPHNPRSSYPMDLADAIAEGRKPCLFCCRPGSAL